MGGSEGEIVPVVSVNRESIVSSGFFLLDKNEGKF